MNAWLALPDLLRRDGAVVLVTVARVVGSAPREVGAVMLVSNAATLDTIGGGRLEWEAIAHARLMLAESSAPQVQRIPLAASLGQCCGGVVWLAFECVAPDALDEWLVRSAELSEGESFVRELSSDAKRSTWQTKFRRVGESTDAGVSLAQLGKDGPPWFLRQTVSVTSFPVVVFGAGHVGEALVRTLLPLQARIVWVETREDVFPPDLAGKVRCVTTDSPEEEMRAALPGSFVLVLTHSHAIDLELCAAGLARTDFAYFGLIGSRSKRNRFEQRLAARGITDEALANMICPIGIAGIRSKEPAVIAASVVAQLLQVRESLAPPSSTSESTTRLQETYKTR